MNFSSWGLTGPSGSNQPKGVMEEVMRSGNVPIAGKMGVVGGGGVVPPTLLDEARVPKFYLDALIACGATSTNMLPHTALVYNLMVTSGLPRPVLSYIWSAVNRSLPGQLTRPEFFSCLALIALAQKGESLVALSGMSQLPIPFLQSFMVLPTNVTPSTSAAPLSAAPIPIPPLVNFVRPPPSAPNPIFRQQIPTNTATTAQASPSRSRFIPSAFIPSSLLPKWPEKASSNHVNQASENKNVPTAAKPTTAVDLSKTLEPSPAPMATDWSLLDSPIPNEAVFLDQNSSNSKKESIPAPLPSGPKPINSEQLDCLVKALCAACEIVEEANTLWSVSLSEDVLREVATTKRGRDYLDSLEKAVAIIGRIGIAGNALIPPDLTERACKANATWNRLSSLHQSTPVTAGEKHYGLCDICSNIVHEHEDLDYGGQKYHVECANLWINRVAPILPNLTLK